jgi:ADP-ribosylglycohydrolase
MIGQPSGADGRGSSRATIRRAWHVASKIVASRPWLDVTWADWYADAGHLVVHDGAYGPALHFDRYDGPTLESRSSPERELEWADVEDTTSSNEIALVDWVGLWGLSVGSPELTAKALTYELVAHLLDGDGNAGEWSARPAKLIHNSDVDADAPDSAFTLTGRFASLASTVEWYVKQLGSPSWGPGTIWHEPLWLVSRDDEPRLVLDEAGHVHLTTSSLSEVLSVVVATAELGGIDDPYGFDLPEALQQLNGSSADLAELLRCGPGKTLQIVKRPGNNEPTGQEPGNVSTSQPFEEEPGMIADRRLTKLHRTPVAWESKVRGLMIGLALGDAVVTGGEAITPAGTLLAGAATQMAAWTAEGLLRRATRYGNTDITGMNVSSTAVDSITYAYQRWARLRGIACGHDDVEHPGWLQDVPAMAERRGHSSSLERAMETGQRSLRDTCRPVLRALPVAVFAGRDRFAHCDARQAGEFARAVSEITHQLAVVGDATELAVRIAVQCLGRHESFATAFQAAISEVSVPPGLAKVVLAARGASERPADRAVLCLLAPDDTSASVLAGAIYTGLALSDWSTAADAVEFARQAPDGDGVAGLVGAFLGALHGYEAFPTGQVARLELGWVMDRLAIDLALEVRENQVPEGGWKEYGEPWIEPWWDAKYPGSS